MFHRKRLALSGLLGLAGVTGLFYSTEVYDREEKRIHSQYQGLSKFSISTKYARSPFSLHNFILSSERF